MTVPLPADEAERLEALRALGILDTAPEDIYDDITRLAAYICGVPIAAVTLVDSERQWFKSIIGLEVLEIPRDDAFCAHTILQTDVLIIQDTQVDARFTDNPFVTDDPNVRFYAGAPLMTSDGHALGSLCVLDRVPRRLTSDQEEALRVLARQVTSQIELARRLAQQARLAVERDRAEEALRRSEARLTEAQGVARIGSWEYCLATGRLRWSPEMFRLYGFDPAEGEPDIDAVIARYHPEDMREHAPQIRQAERDGKPYEADLRVVLPDGEARWLHALGRGERGADGSVVRLYGTAMDLTDRKMAEERIKDYSVVLQCKMAELEQANARLAALATTDGLTGLKNHRAFQERLASEVSRTARYGTPLSVVLLDVDRFKQFNDSFGHPAGDEVLRQVARILQVCARETDLVARYGGEEFALILPQTDSLGAMAIAERVRHSIQTAPWPERPITASFGVATLTPGLDGGGLIAHADRSLYEAKSQGRNRVSG